MEIKTKYGIGDRVWFLDHQNRPVQAEIVKLSYNVTIKGVSEEYGIVYPVGAECQPESSTYLDVTEIGSTKQELQQILNSYFD